MERVDVIDADESLGKRNSDESFVWEEWTVIEEDGIAKNRKIPPSADDCCSSSQTSYSDIDDTSDAEEAQELAEKTAEKSSVDSGPSRNEESDGVSVITESENEEAIVDDVNEGKIILYKNASDCPEDQRRDNIFKEVATFVNLLIACSMVIAIGTGLGMMRADYDDTISSDLDFMKMENDKLPVRVRDSSGAVKKILDMIKSSVAEDKFPVLDETQNPTMKDDAIFSAYTNEPLDRTIIDSDTTKFERLQIFLQTICLVLEDMRRPSETINRDRTICDNHSWLSDLALMRSIFKNVIAKMDDPILKSTNERFLDNVEFRINSMSDSLVEDLTRALDKLKSRNQRKLEKVVKKMNHKLCVLRNTLSSENKIRQSLEINSTFFNNCDNMGANKFDKRKKEKRRREESIPRQPVMVEKKNETTRMEKAPRNFDSVKKFRFFKSKRENITTPYNRTKGPYQEISWETRKCCNANWSNYLTESQEKMCSSLSPRSAVWKSVKHRLPVQRKKNGKNERYIDIKKSSQEWSIVEKLRLKEDRFVSKYSKIKKEFDETENSKSSSHSSSVKMAHVYKKKKPSREKKAKSRSSFTDSRNAEKDVEFKEKYSGRGKYLDKATIHRDERRKSRENTNNSEKREQNDIWEKENWQFERSRNRDQLRKIEPTVNWYLDRFNNRRNSRLEDAQ